MPDHAETIFAVSSGRPPAAIAIIRISGARAQEAGERLAGSLPSPRTAAVRKLVDPATGELLDRAVVLRFAAPATATGEDVVELHCHGGRAVVDAVLAVLAAEPGLRAAEPGEFTRRSFTNGRIDLTQAEGLADLLAAETEAQRRVALAIVEGGLRERIEQWRDRLVTLSARVERLIDYDDEDDGGADPALRADCEAFTGDLAAWLAEPRAEPLRDGVRVVVAGPPNVGKSSLINAIAGYERAIVSASPGTTRDHIDVRLALGGMPLVLTDTAGLRDTRDAIEALGVARAAALVEAADILLWLGDSAPPAHPRVVLIHPRADLPERQSVPAGRLAVSARTQDGIAALLEMIRARATEILPAEGGVVLNQRQAAHIDSVLQAISDTAGSPDVAVLAHGLLRARNEFDRILGRSGIEDMLDALFSRFCLGK